MSELLPSIAEPGALTAALRRAGTLADGRVRAVEVVSTRPTVLSRITRLKPTYDGPADAAPATLILKTPLPERRAAGWNGGRHEVAFYIDVAPQMPPGLVPRCLDAAWHEATNDWHLLLEDLSESHLVLEGWPLPPNAADCARIMVARARVHAAWWDHGRLGSGVGEWPDDAEVKTMLANTEARVASLVDQLGDDFPPARRRLYERYLQAAPRLLQRYHARRNLTLVHGDAHVWNCFLPRDPQSPDVRLFDWDCWRPGLATDDLAYMMALHWYPERRQRLERPLLDAYHATLSAHGVEGYDRAALDDDYRLAVLRQMNTPIHQAAFDVPPTIWWPHLDRIWRAVDDLDCAALL